MKLALLTALAALAAPSAAIAAEPQLTTRDVPLGGERTLAAAAASPRAFDLVGLHCPPNTYPEQWDVEGLKDSIEAVFGLKPPVDDWLEEEAVEPEIFDERLQQLAGERMEGKVAGVDMSAWHMIEKNILRLRDDVSFDVPNQPVNISIPPRRRTSPPPNPNAAAP